MSRLLLKIRRGSKIIGTWSLDDAPLEMLIEDSRTGEVLGSFVAQGTESLSSGVDELPLIKPGRGDGDDLTMPLPELTSSVDLPLPESTDSLDLPLPEPTGKLESRSRPLVSGSLSHTRQYIADAIQQRRGKGIRELASSDDLSLPTAEPSAELRGKVETSSWAEDLSVHPDPNLSGAFKAHLPPAEVWLRRAREWHARGTLSAGHRLEAGGGWIGLDTEGRLVVNTGPRLTGTVTRLDGTSYELDPGDPSRLLSLGASVILREGDSGIYVRSMLPDHERLEQPTEESTR